MIDLHCHVLPGLDDGPATMEDALAIARAASAAGTRTMVATPHVSWDFPQNTAQLIRSSCDEVNERLRAEGIAIEVRPGAEIAMTRAGDLDEEELKALRLAGGAWLLIEAPYSPAAAGFDAILHGLQARGHRIVIAHPERCPAFLRDRGRLESFVGGGMLCSVTAGSIAGRFGRDPKRFGVDLVRDGLAHNVASDAHDAVRRPPGMGPELEEAGLGALTGWLTNDIPRAVIDGGPLPPAPALAPAPRGVFARLLRRA